MEGDPHEKPWVSEAVSNELTSERTRIGPTLVTTGHLLQKCPRGSSRAGFSAKEKRRIRRHAGVRRPGPARTRLCDWAGAVCLRWGHFTDKNLRSHSQGSNKTPSKPFGA